MAKAQTTERKGLRFWRESAVRPSRLSLAGSSALAVRVLRRMVRR
jgi:hypothetical protein